MIIDTQFYVIYALKGLRILFAYIALFLATRIFVPMYEDTVYDAKKDPPELWRYILIFVGFDFSLNVFLLVLLYLVKYLFKNEDNTFIIDGYLVNNHIFDYGFSMVCVVIVGVLISKVITQKKYFKYKYEGMRAIRAFEEIMFRVSVVGHLIPFYMLT
jgi:hypothetical protein